MSASEREYRSLTPRAVEQIPDAAGEQIDILSPATVRLLKDAASADEAALDGDSVTSQVCFQRFARSYKEWIILEYASPGSPQLRMEQTQMLLHSVIGAPTLGEALALLVRFSKVLRGEKNSVELRDDHLSRRIVYTLPIRPGVEGLITEMWALSLMLCELEFLVGGQLQGVSGRVRSGACLPETTARLLFDDPIEYATDQTALILPKVHLRRSVVARSSEIREFVADNMPIAMGPKAQRADMPTLIAGILRNDKLRGSDVHSDLGELANRLGCSTATVRRRLAARGTSFRQIKESVFDELAKGWLTGTDLPIDEIADRLGYSDGFAFRRAFKRRNNISPLAYRRTPADENYRDR